MKLINLRKSAAMGAAVALGITMFGGSTLAFAADDSSDLPGATVIANGESPLDNVVGFTEDVEATASTDVTGKNTLAGAVAGKTLDPNQLCDKDLFCMTSFGGAKNLVFTFDENLMRLGKGEPLRILLKAPKAAKIVVNKLQSTAGAPATEPVNLVEATANDKYTGGYVVNFEEFAGAPEPINRASDDFTYFKVYAVDAKNRLIPMENVQYTFGGDYAKIEVAKKKPTSIAADLIRLGGKDRVATSVKVWQAMKSDSVVLAGYHGVPDAYTGGYFAANFNTSVVYTLPKALPNELQDAVAAGDLKNAYILGGPTLVSKEVEAKLKSAGVNVVRLYGKDRYETAVATAKYLVQTKNLDVDELDAVLVTGKDFADALVSTPVAINYKAVTLLTLGDTLPASTKNYLGTLGGKIHAVGTPAVKAVNNNETFKARAGELLGGTDRFATANNVAKTVFPNADTYAIVNYNAAPDGAVAGGYIGVKGGAVLLAMANTLPESTVETMNHGANIVLVGGTGLLTKKLETFLED